MNCSEKLKEKIKKLRNNAEKILEKGLIGSGPEKLERTLETHEHLKYLLEELEYLLQKDIPEEEVLAKISIIEKEIDTIQSESER